MKNKLSIIFLVFTFLLIIIITGCSALGKETLTPGEKSWTMIAQYPTETTVACKTGALWAQVINDLGTEYEITESIWFKESDFPDWEFGWILDEDYGKFFLFYDEDSDGCITKAEGTALVPDFENEDAANLAGLIFVAVPNFFDETFDPYSKEAVGESAVFLDEETPNCAGATEYEASFVDTSGNTWIMKCGYYQEGSLLSILFESK